MRVKLFAATMSLVVLFALAGCGGGSATGTSSNTTNNSSDAIIAKYTFENGVIDTTGLTNGTTVHGTTTAVGISGNGLYFDGDSYVKVPSEAINPQEGTVSLWVKPETSDNELKFILGSVNDRRTDGTRLYVLYKGTEIFGSYLKNSFGYTTVSTNKWYHVAISWKGNNAKFYINGSPIESTTSSGEIYPNIYLGSYIGDHGFFTGIIDELYFYNTQLSDGEVKRLYDKFAINTPSGSDSNISTTEISIPKTLYTMAKYSTCGSESYAYGTLYLGFSGSTLTDFSYSGDDWHHDCTVTQGLTLSGDLSSYNLTSPLTNDGLKKLCQGMYNDPYMQVTVGNVSNSGFMCSFFDTYDGSTEEVTFSKTPFQGDLSSPPTTTQPTTPTSSAPLAYTGTWTGTRTLTGGGYRCQWDVNVTLNSDFSGSALGKPTYDNTGGHCIEANESFDWAITNNKLKMFHIYSNTHQTTSPDRYIPFTSQTSLYSQENTVINGINAVDTISLRKAN